MADKQTDADKAAAMKEYRQQHDAAVDRIAALRAARLARDADAPEVKPAAKSAAKSATKSAAKSVAKSTTKPAAKTGKKTAAKSTEKPVLLAKKRS